MQILYDMEDLPVDTLNAAAIIAVMWILAWEHDSFRSRLCVLEKGVLEERTFPVPDVCHKPLK